MGDKSDGGKEWDLMDFQDEGGGSKRPLSPEEIENIVGYTRENPFKKQATGKKADKVKRQETDKQTNNQTTKNNNTKTSTNPDKTISATKFNTKNNNSLKMREILNKKYKCLFYINTTKYTNRLQMANLWSTKQKNSNDVIIQTKKGYLLKSNSDKKTLLKELEILKKEQHITNFEETNEKTHTPKTNTITASYSAVITTVELEITDEDLSNYLNNINIEHRYCKRIISRNTGKNTYLIRIITGDIRSYEKLLNEGLFYKNRHYPVYTSKPPPPAPLACGNCFEFTHKTEDCPTPTKCHKCHKNHQTSKCTSQLPIKCTACDAEDHAAWSFKCPKRPTSPINNIPNIPIKSINKKTDEINSDLKKENRIHSNISKHDYIIDTYIGEINDPRNIDREEVIQRIRQKFVNLWNIDTAAVFTQNRLYILMFDLETNFDSPTEPLPSLNSHQWIV